jgi:hypothetical protein
MDKNLKFLTIFTMIYGLLAVGMLSLSPQSASLRVADGIGNFEADAPGAFHVVLASAE